jgi:uncharacterized protein (DUF1697 family)
MDRLRALFEELAFRDVSTFIASGNVIFSTDSIDRGGLRDVIQGHLEGALGYDVATFLRTPAELAEIAEEGENAAWDSYESHYVTFLHEPASDSLQAALNDLGSDTDAFHFAEREAHWHTRGKVSESPLFGGELTKVFRGLPTTMRNMNTVRRLVSKTGSSEGR